MWVSWLELAIVHLQLSPDQFWSLTPYEWKLTLDGYKTSYERSQRDIGILSWSTGVASKADLKRTGFERWMEQFEDKEVVSERRKRRFENGAKLWKTMCGE